MRESAANRPEWGDYCKCATVLSVFSGKRQIIMVRVLSRATETVEYSGYIEYKDKYRCDGLYLLRMAGSMESGYDGCSFDE